MSEIEFLDMIMGIAGASQNKACATIYSLARERRQQIETCDGADCRRFHTVADFARRNGISERTVFRWIKENGLPVSAKTGRIPCKDARDWLENRHVAVCQ